MESPLRRPRLVLVPMLTAAVAACAVGWLLPARYRAAALLGVEWDASFEAALRERGIDNAERRLRAVRERLTDRSLLARTASEALAASAEAPDAGSPLRSPEDPLLAGLRVQPVSANAFALEFVHRDPATAALVPNTLGRLLVESAASRPAATTGALAARLVEARRVMQEAAAALESKGATAARAARRRDAAAAGDPARAAYEAARETYEGLLAEFQAAETKARLGQGSIARLDLLRTAPVPQQPESPAAWQYALAGALAGLLLGLAAALVAEHRDGTVKGAEDLARILPVPLLTVVPELRTGRRD